MTTVFRSACEFDIASLIYKNDHTNLRRFYIVHVHLYGTEKFDYNQSLNKTEYCINRTIDKVSI